MSNFVGIPPSLNTLYVMCCHGNHAFTHGPNMLIFKDNLAPMKNCPVEHGKLNWPPDYCGWL